MRIVSKPCKACPFRKKAPAGWLGPWNPEGLIQQVMSEGGFACHRTVKESGNPDGTMQCAGALICANKSCKSYIDPELVKAQESMQDHPETDTVMRADEFVTHHENAKVKSWEMS